MLLSNTLEPAPDVAAFLAMDDVGDWVVVNVSRALLGGSVETDCNGVVEGVNEGKSSTGISLGTDEGR